jgi:cytochrome c-type biogenesis protein CcmH
VKQRLVILFFILFANLFAGIARPALAQDPRPTPSDNDVNRVAKQMFCPVCENIPLDVCPTQACSEWRELIREKLAAGWTDEQIKDYFAAQYGDRVLAEPPRQGLNWLVYLLPPTFIGIGAIVVWRVLSSMKSRKPQGAEMEGLARQAGQDDPYLARLEEELKKTE